MSKKKQTPLKKGKLKILAGPAALTRLLSKADSHGVVADGQTLSWKSTDSPGASIRGDQIRSVSQQGSAFVVDLVPTGNGVNTLSFQARSSSDAAEWVAAIQAIKAAAKPVATKKAVAAGPAKKSAGHPIKLTYRLPNEAHPIDAEYDLLVIACDPRELIGICDYSPADLEILNKLVNFTFHTTLLEVKVPSTPQVHAVIFAPQPLDLLNGGVYGFRNESAKQFGLDKANRMERNLVTVYQLLGARQTPLTPDQFLDLLRTQLPTLHWWPFGDAYSIEDSVTTPYFDHFHLDDLRGGAPWKLLDNQGDKHTLLVHASTCFESALHCWGYANLMLSTVAGALAALPRDKGAPIAILGAGVSGLLFATRLTRMGYTNVEILESAERYGGKTHTIVKKGPYPAGSTESTVCELGTCYLSPAYDPMVAAFKDFLLGNKQIDFTQADPAFRGIVTKGELPASYHVPEVLSYSDYVILKAEAERGKDNTRWERLLATADLAYDLAKYTRIYPEYLGWNPPMPAKPPAALKHDFGQQTFLEFLQAHGLSAMVGMLQYGYEVQGYGPLKQIPAYYGLVWITPIITWTILADQLKIEDKPVVTAWTKGWGDLWKQIVEKQHLKITFSAKTTSIVRS